MRKENKTIMEIKNVSYVEKPHAFLQFKLAGFSTAEIQVIRTDSSHYYMTATKGRW